GQVVNGAREVVQHTTAEVHPTVVLLHDRAGIVEGPQEVMDAVADDRQRTHIGDGTGQIAAHPLENFRLEIEDRVRCRERAGELNVSRAAAGVRARERQLTIQAPHGSRLYTSD